MHLCVKYLAIVTLQSPFFYFRIITDSFAKLVTKMLYSNDLLFIENTISGKHNLGWSLANP